MASKRAGTQLKRIRNVTLIAIDTETPTVQKKQPSSLVICKTECSMIDAKMVSLLQGNSGAFCHLCDVSCAETNDVGLIKRGFIITKDFESTRGAWEKANAGAIANNHAERKGQCHPNLVQADYMF